MRQPVSEFPSGGRRIFHCMSAAHFVFHASVNGRLGCSSLHSTALHLGVRHLSESLLSVLLGLYPEVRLLDRRESCLMLWGVTAPPLTAAAPLCAPLTTSAAFGFSGLQPSSRVWGGISLWFWFAFPQWLVILTIFSWACRPFICLLRISTLQVLCPFYIRFLLFLLSCRSSLYILNINLLPDI